MQKRKREQLFRKHGLEPIDAVVGQDYLKEESTGIQEIIPGIEPVLPPEKKPMTVTVHHTGFTLRDGDVVFVAEIRTSEKLPTKARKAIAETLSRAFQALVGNIERQGGIPGDLASAQLLVTPVEPVAPQEPQGFTMPVPQ